MKDRLKIIENIATIFGQKESTFLDKNQTLFNRSEQQEGG